MFRLLALLLMMLARPAPAQPELDPMDSAAGWKVITSDAVTLTVTPEATDGGHCLRLDYHFTTGAGYGIIQKPFALTMPENYEFSVRLRGEGPDNNLEFKLLDETGDNVWWHIRRAYDWPREWTRLVSKRRDIEFAWGPAAGEPLTKLAKLEFAISSSEGGKGTVWLDGLTFRELPKPRAEPARLIPAAGQEPGVALAIDNDANTAWTTARPASIILDQGEAAEFGGVEVHWGVPARTFSLESSDDSKAWTRLSAPRPAGIAETVVPTPNAQARYLRLSFEPGDQPAEVREVRLRPADFSSTPNAIVQSAAVSRPRGMLPRQFRGELPYWTVIGADGGAAEALINEDGAVELGKRGCSIEPAVRIRGRLITWADADRSQFLARGYLPVPTVVWGRDGVSLTVTAFVAGTASDSAVYVMYELRNVGEDAADAQLHLALRPFQVNPVSQRLNFDGGVSAIREVATDRTGLVVNGSTRIHALTTPESRAATTWAQGEAFDWLGAGVEPDTTHAICPDALASGVLTYTAPLKSGEALRVVIAAPLEGTPTIDHPQDPWAHAMRLRAEVEQAWEERVSRASITVPRRDAWLADSFKAQLAYILINRDGPAIQPGSRSYERSWARDGSLTSAALLACGHPEEVRAWIDWYGQHLFDSGKVPCVVDKRGPDPVPEHDSHGQYIWAVANYYRHTRDPAFLDLHWPRVQKVVGYIRSLRAERSTEAYKADTFPEAACFGLVPESISHEGYSAKPMHSYWDGFFVLLGLREAAWLAEQVRNDELAQFYRDEHDDFRACLRQAIERAQAHHAIDYIPGCVELGDFDATSTTIALFPCDALAALPPAGLASTFNRYWSFAQGRMIGMKWDGYTPYEWRTVGAFIRLDQRDRAYTLLQWFRTHQRPAGWRHWAEVVFNDPRSPRFIGDMPHTWVGSDFLNSIISMFIYERAEQLVAFAGVPKAWADSTDPIAFTNLVTPYGPISGSMQREGGTIRVRVEGVALPAGGLVIAAPPGAQGGDQTFTTLPAQAEFTLRTSDVP